jgi:hypothetical protein
MEAAAGRDSAAAGRRRGARSTKGARRLRRGRRAGAEEGSGRSQDQISLVIPYWRIAKTGLD